MAEKKKGHNFFLGSKSSVIRTTTTEIYTRTGTSQRNMWWWIIDEEENQNSGVMYRYILTEEELWCRVVVKPRIENTVTECRTVVSCTF